MLLSPCPRSVIGISGNKQSSVVGYFRIQFRSRDVALEEMLFLLHTRVEFDEVYLNKVNPGLGLICNCLE